MNKLVGLHSKRVVMLFMFSVVEQGETLQIWKKEHTTH